MAKNISSGGGDISNRTVILVLIIVIVVSIISLGAYMNALDKAQPEVSAATQGEVGITILKAPQAPQIATENGEVGVKIVSPPN